MKKIILIILFVAELSSWAIKNPLVRETDVALYISILITIKVIRNNSCISSIRFSDLLCCEYTNIFVLCDL